MKRKMLEILRDYQNGTLDTSPINKNKLPERMMDSEYRKRKMSKPKSKHKPIKKIIKKCKCKK